MRLPSRFPSRPSLKVRDAEGFRAVAPPRPMAQGGALTQKPAAVPTHAVFLSIP